MDETTTWVCDTCGQLIQAAAHGWVEWIMYSGEDYSKPGRDLRLVHHRPHSPLNQGCQFDRREERAKDGGLIADQSLPEFQGPDGLMELLSMIAEQRLPAAQVIEMVKRLHVPGYEHARRHLQRAVVEGVIEPNTPPGFPMQRQLAAVLESYGSPARSAP